VSPRSAYRIIQNLILFPFLPTLPSSSLTLFFPFDTCTILVFIPFCDPLSILLIPPEGPHPEARSHGRESLRARRNSRHLSTLMSSLSPARRRSPLQQPTSLRPQSQLSVLLLILGVREILARFRRSYTGTLSLHNDIQFVPRHLQTPEEILEFTIARLQQSSKLRQWRPYLHHSPQDCHAYQQEFREYQQAATPKHVTIEVFPHPEQSLIDTEQSRADTESSVFQDLFLLVPEPPEPLALEEQLPTSSRPQNPLCAFAVAADQPVPQPNPLIMPPLDILPPPTIPANYIRALPSCLTAIPSPPHMIVQPPPGSLVLRGTKQHWQANKR
jgi:hypothetical protein